MKGTDRTTAAAIFATRAEAQRAIEELRAAGFRDDQIGIIGTGPDYESASDALVAEGAAAGAAGGGAIGLMAGLAVAAGAIPPLGPAIIGGALVGVLASGALGAAAGGLIGTLVGIGIPEEEARYYEEELVAGQSLVTVRAGYRYDEAVAILRRCGGRDVHTEQTLEPAFPLL
jgi:hypothetical protein